MRNLVERIAALEGYAASHSGIAKEFRMIEIQVARAEDKLMRLVRSAPLRSEMSYATQEKPLG